VLRVRLGVHRRASVRIQAAAGEDPDWDALAGRIVAAARA
jgi:hypothetical protein